MASLVDILKYPDDIYPLLKPKLTLRHAKKQIPLEPHWAFCYTILHKISRSFALCIQQLNTNLRNAVLMDEFHHVSTAFLELDKGFQEIIEDITMRMGAGMAKFISQEVETIDDYNEYCHFVAGFVGIGLSEVFHASGSEDLAPDTLSSSIGLFLQKTNIIRDYLEDINEIPKPRMFWRRQIWEKYVENLEDLKNVENSVKAVQCLNEMVTNALIHVEDCLPCMAELRTPIFRSCAIPQIIAMGTLALSYANKEFFRGVVKMRPGLAAQVFEQTKSMSDVYGAFYDFACMLKLKVNKDDPNATKTLSNIKAIQKICRESGTLDIRNCSKQQ